MRSQAQTKAPTTKLASVAVDFLGLSLHHNGIRHLGCSSNDKANVINFSRHCFSDSRDQWSSSDWNVNVIYVVDVQGVVNSNEPHEWPAEELSNESGEQTTNTEPKYSSRMQLSSLALNTEN